MLRNKNILVTGGSRGIGKAIVLELALQGANVGFTYLSSEASAQEIVKEIEKMGLKAKAYQVDVSDFKASAELIENFIRDFGSLEALVNNAGITKDNLLLRMSEENWDDVLRTNLKSCFNTVKAATKQMMKQKNGSIVNISSIVGLKGNAGQANYAASKAGMIGFSKSVALELGSRNIRCNVIAPGFIETEMTAQVDAKMKEEWMKSIPLKRMGQPQDIAHAVVFLCSDNASYITGQTLAVCGGMV
jgi:3-oxoacyl-[acyl-carrier protein] reductase